MPARVIRMWRTVLLRAWSVRIALLGGLFAGIVAATPFLDWITTDTRQLFWVIVISNIGVAVVRVLPQKGLDEDA